MTTTTPIPSQETFRDLLSQYLNLVYSSALRQLRNPHLAEDATQAVFLLLHQRHQSIPRNRISSWLLTATRFTCNNLRKSERRRARREQVAAMNTPTTSSPDPTPETATLLAHLDDALAHLPSLDRETLALHFLQQKPYPDLAASLGISEDAARKRTQRALQKLRNWFHRRNISAATLPTLLPTQAHTLPPTLHETLFQQILNNCQAGAAAPAASLAKGTQTMLTLHSLKPAAIITAAILLATATGLTWHALSTPTLAAPAATPGPTAGALPVTTDLSSPDKTLDSYINALRAGDRTAAYACTTADPNRTPSANDAFCNFNLAQNRLINSAAKAFNSNGEEARRFPTLDVILSGVLTYNRLRNVSPTIAPDTLSATLPFDLPDALLSHFPPDIQKQIKSFTGHPIRFHKQINQWKLDHAVAVTILLTTPKGALLTDPQTQFNVINDYAAIYDKLAAELAANTYPTWNDAAASLKSDVEDLHKKYNLTDINIQLAPATTLSPSP